MNSKIILLIFICIYETNGAFVRKNAKDMTFPEWQAFRRGIAKMKARSQISRVDPLGYTYQANVHGWEKYDASEEADKIADKYRWHQCQHGHYFFLVWHRMYLYYFEKILRKVSQAPLTVPYWDYFDPEQRSIPEPMRIPANNVTNPLYVNERCSDLNLGKPLPPELVSPYPALRSGFFTTNKRDNELNVCHALGGARVDKPIFESDNEGLLEMIPHNNIHLYVGGPNGFMSDNCRSSRDPVFFIHHSQVDRIWESWTQANPEWKKGLDMRYMNQTFDFFDENGQPITVRVMDFMNISRLGYKYDKLIDKNRVDYLSEKDESRGAIDYKYEETPKLYISVDETNRQKLVVNPNQMTISVNIKPEYQNRMEKLATGEVDHIRSSLQLSVEYLQTDLIFYVYLNLPPNTLPYESKPYFVGALTYIPTKCVPKRNRDINLDITNCYDITDNLRRILRNSLNYSGYVPKQLNLTFVPMLCGSSYEANGSERLMSLNRVMMIHYIYSK